MPRWGFVRALRMCSWQTIAAFPPAKGAHRFSAWVFFHGGWAATKDKVSGCGNSSIGDLVPHVRQYRHRDFECYWNPPVEILREELVLLELKLELSLRL